jgi:hypothetical protein
MATTMHSDTPRNRGDYDAPHVSPVSPAEDMRTVLINKISWGAVLAGVVTALVTQLLLNMLGVGVGAASLDPATGNNPSASTFSITAGIWWAASTIIAAFAGGYVASRLSGRPKPSTGGWHGLTSWAATTLLVFYLLSSAVGSLVGGAFSTVSTAMGGLGRTAAAAAQSAAPALANSADPFASIEQSIRGATGSDPAALRDNAVTAMRGLVTGNPADAAAARDRAAEAFSRAQGIPIEEARTRVAALEQQYRQTVQQATQAATQAADAAATAVSRGALLGSLTLLLGALAAWLGGLAGAVDPTVTARFRGRDDIHGTTGQAIP